MNCEVTTVTGKELKSLSWDFGDLREARNWVEQLVLFAVNSVRSSVAVYLERDRDSGEAHLLVWTSDGSTEPGAAFDQVAAKRISLQTLVAKLIEDDARDPHEHGVLPAIADALLKASIDLRDAAETKRCAARPSTEIA